MKNFLFLVFLLPLFLVNSQNKQQEDIDSTFRRIEIKLLNDNAVSLFVDNWFVLTAGNDSAYNQMTISWGSLGWLWNSPVATVYVRDKRYTYQFINKGKYFTLCAFDEKYRDKVQFIGSNSGRKIDKIKETGLTPLKTKFGNIYYKEARLVIECEKIYAADLIPENILDTAGSAYYKDTDSRHRMFIGKILTVWEKK